LERFNFLVYLRNSIVVTVAATIITLPSTAWLIALAKYQFRSDDIPDHYQHADDPDFCDFGVCLLVITGIGWNNNLA
jgi:hypothetical protein